MQETLNQNPIITVVRDPRHRLGKQFDIDPDGTIRKKSAVNVSFGIAVQHHVPTHEGLAKLLNEIGNDPSAALINASFPGVEVGEEFILLSEKEIEERLGIPRSDRARQKAIHQIEHDGKPYKGVGRFKESVRPSNWQLLDRDVDDHTPAHLANLSSEDWLVALSSLIPGVDQVSYVIIPSASARVLRDDQPVGSGNGHIWVYVQNPEDMDRARTAIQPLAWQVGMAWKKPRHSRKDPTQTVATGQACLIDQSVWTTGRLVFDGQPVVGKGLIVMQQQAQVVRRAHTVLDTSTIVQPDRDALHEASLKAGVKFEARTDAPGIRITANDLRLDSDIETKRHGNVTVRELLKAGNTNKVRCQSPFRNSDSWAAFLSVNGDGIPYVYDSGTSTTHWLNEFEKDEAKWMKASATVAVALPKVTEDSTAVLEDDVVSSLATIKQTKPADYHRKRAALKQANSKVSLTALDSAVKGKVLEMVSAQTHHGYAKSLLAELVKDAWKPVGHQNLLFVLNPDTRLWSSLSVTSLVKTVADMHDGKEHCSRSSDYKAIAEHAVSLASDDTFFANAPIGVACPGGFYQIVGDDIALVPLLPEHRQRVMLSITPIQQGTPQFDAFLQDTFASRHTGEKEQQVILVQEIAGAIMLGLMPRYHKAALFYEPFGRAGKGTLERILRNLVPTIFVTAVSPFKWAQDYHVATLAGSRLNVVGELPENEAIPASIFKSVIGGDLITGRHPTHRPITFTNEAAHLFMSNHLITTKDQSEAFFSRWLIVGFPNSRLRSGLPLDPALADRIITSELPGIAYWALEGAKSLIRQGKFSPSAAHDRLMAKWRRSTSSLDEYIHECCELCSDRSVRRSEFYVGYTRWCNGAGRKPFAKNRVKELLEHNIGMGVRLVEVNGYEVFRGLKLKAVDTYGNPKVSSGTTPESTDHDVFEVDYSNPDILF